ncbi:MAG: hypothetical protein IPJ85_05830 [Flavobacteriales bacterium]|nr:hypothetical protein [Flavobacteriales bacterium]
MPDTAMTDGLILDAAYGMVSMKDGRNWIGRNIRGLAYFDKAKGKWTDLVDDVNERRVRVGRLVGLTAANDSVLWLASDGAGLIQYSIPTGTYKHFDQHHGITELGLNNVVLDNRGRAWANSEERVFCFDPAKERAIVVNPRSSTGGDAPKWTLGMSRGGLLAMNVGYEIAVFDANAVGSEPAPPAPVLSQVLIDGVAMDPGSDGAITMRYDQTLLDVRFGAILPPGYIKRYAVRLDDAEWSKAPKAS